MKLKRQLLVLLAICLATLGANAQMIQGLKLPQLTTAQRDQIQKQGDPNNPYANGQTIYNLDNNCMEYWNGTEWVSFCAEPPCVPVTSVEITSDTLACMGASLNMIATPAGGTWSSSNPEVATIDPATGELTTVAEGTTVITYSYTDTTDCTAKDTKTITVADVVFTQDNPAAASICNGATRAITLAAATGGLGTITYQWQSSSNNSTWTNISGATSANYTTPALTVSTYYRRQATAATCGGTISSNSALVTVAPVLTQGNPAAATICNGATRAITLAAASGGSGTITYQWQSSTNNSTWTSISGATAANYTTPALTANTYYRRQATAATCGGTISSASALITVTAAFTQPNPAAVSIGYNATHTFSLGAASGGSGAITYNWQQSTNGSTWTNATGTRTNATYTTPALTANTYYRRQATAATCGGTINSTSALVTVTAAASVKVGTYTWATKNLQGSGARGGTFVANVYNKGMIYQFNRSTGWPATGTVTGWNSTGDAATTDWAVGNDPCPAGFRIPTLAQISNLLTQPYVFLQQGNTVPGLGGVYGRIYGPGANATSFDPSTQIFLPTGSPRLPDGTLISNTYNGYYYSRNGYGSSHAGYGVFNDYTIQLREDYDTSRGAFLRCVKE